MGRRSSFLGSKTSKFEVSSGLDTDGMYGGRAVGVYDCGYMWVTREKKTIFGGEDVCQ